MLLASHTRCLCFHNEILAPIKWLLITSLGYSFWILILISILTCHVMAFYLGAMTIRGEYGSRSVLFDRLKKLFSGVGRLEMAAIVRCDPLARSIDTRAGVWTT